MATLTNTRIKNTYDGLLKTTDNDALGGTYKLITDGLGNSSNIYLGTGGNLGIGIIPTEKFHVNGDAIVSGDLHVDAIKPIASSNPIKFKNFASTELVRITDSGNVGIGETDPSKPLTINKNQSETAILVQSSDTGLSGIYLGGQSDSIKGGLILDNSDNSLQLRGYNNANRLHIDSSGRVGIGTSSPSLFFNQARNLVVGGSGNIGATIYSSNSGNTFLAFADVADGANSGFNAGGSIYYEHANDAMAIRVNGSERMRIDSSGNVGIGESNPDEKLEIAGDVKIQGADSGNAGVLHFGNDSDQVKIAGFDSGGSSVQNSLLFYTNTNERMRIDSSGDVGIGTTDPKQLLHIASTSAQSVITLQRTNSNTTGAIGALQWTAIDNHTVASMVALGDGNNEGAHITFNTTSAASSDNPYGISERMRIDSSGNVGIGTSNPAGKLEINGGIGVATSGGTLIVRQDGDTLADGIALTSSNSISHRMFKNANGTFLMGPSSNAEAFALDLNGNVGIGTNQPQTLLQLSNNNSSTNTEQGAISFAGDTASRYSQISGFRFNNSNQAGLDFKVYNGALNNAMRITNTGAVGIGTSSPDVNFQVGDGTTDAISRFYFNDNTYTQINGYGLYMSRNSSYIRPTTDNTKILNIGAATKQWNVLSMDASATLFNTNGSENMRITATGNVGIGTGANVDEKLHIQGSVDNDDVALKIENTFNDNSSSTPPSAAVVFSTYSNNGHIRVFGAPANTAANHKMDIGATASSSYLTFSPSNSEKMRINSNGNVGIGTNNPLANLHVYGNGKGALIRSTQSIGLEVQGGGNGQDIAIFKNTSGTEKFSLNTNGQMFNLGMASSSSANASLMHNSSTGLIYRYTSSIRYKEDVKDLTNAVDKMMKLRPVEFKPKDSLKYTTGMIAEEVFEVMPEITFKAKIEGFDEPQVDGISYEPMHAYYIKAIQEQQEMINELKSDIETLKSQINS